MTERALGTSTGEVGVDADGPPDARTRAGDDVIGNTAHLVALAGLPGMGPARLGAVLSAYSAVDGWEQVVSGRLVDRPEVFAGVRGRHGDLCRAWQRAARAVDVDGVWQQHESAGVRVHARSDSGFPRRLLDDPEPPAVLFRQGDLVPLDGPTVGIVGTRRCTRYGHDVARDLGAELAAAGVTVVSGLASGIDAAAHRGVLDAGGVPPVAVVATGLDVVYPRSNRTLWHDVAASGVIVSESPLGTSPEAWRFPARNRIIAGLSDAVIVVESHAAGGSLYTVEEAVVRDRPVLAVPGPIRSKASEGTNRLLVDGASPLCSIEDVFVALGLIGGDRSPGHGGPDLPEDPGQRAVLEAMGWEPCSLDQLASATPLDFDELSLAVERLAAAGLVDRQGAWLERVAR